MPWTKEQWREYNRQYYLKHRDELLPRHRESAQRWREEHPERVLAYKRENKEKVRLHRRNYRQKHREELRVKNKKWREEHPDYLKKWRKRRRLKQKLEKLYSWLKKIFPKI